MDSGCCFVIVAAEKRHAVIVASTKHVGSDLTGMFLLECMFGYVYLVLRNSNMWCVIYSVCMSMPFALLGVGTRALSLFYSLYPWDGGPCDLCFVSTHMLPVGRHPTRARACVPPLARFKKNEYGLYLSCSFSWHGRQMWTRGLLQGRPMGSTSFQRMKSPVVPRVFLCIPR